MPFSREIDLLGLSISDIMNINSGYRKTAYPNNETFSFIALTINNKPNEYKYVIYSRVLANINFLQRQQLNAYSTKLQISAKSFSYSSAYIGYLLRAYR